MLVDGKNKHRKSPKKRLPAQKKGWYSDSQKIEAVKLWMITGNMPTVSATLNIPLVTIKSWRYSEWWSELVNEIKTENSIQLSAKLRNIASKALDVTVDRLENGDWIYDQKTGEMRRKPVLMKDAHKVSVDLYDKADKVEKKPVEENTKTQDILLNLAKKFEEFAKAKKVEVTDVIYIEEKNDAVHEEPNSMQELSEDESVISESMEQEKPKILPSNNLQRLRESPDSETPTTE